jgi:hypothetical protein
MGRSIVEPVVIGAISFVAVLAIASGQTFAATKQAKESSPVAASVKPAKQHQRVQHQPIRRAKKSSILTVPEHKSEAIQKRAKPVRTETKPANPKGSRPMKVHKEEALKAAEQPRTDLMYHGMLESPQRYDPRRHHLDGGVPNPHTSELIHDHFQELDRNQDGTIDPVERTFGRPDMDRDLHDRRPR